jgi:hypothetical protein
MADNPHGVMMRGKVLDAILERVRGRAGLKALALEIEGLISALRESEAVEWEPELDGEDLPWVLMDEKVAAFSMRTPSMKSMDPLRQVFTGRSLTRPRGGECSPRPASQDPAGPGTRFQRPRRLADSRVCAAPCGSGTRSSPPMSSMASPGARYPQRPGRSTAPDCDTWAPWLRLAGSPDLRRSRASARPNNSRSWQKAARRR